MDMIDADSVLRTFVVKVPSTSTMSRALLELDCAILLHTQAENRACSRVRFLLADASPSRHINWLWAEHDGVDVHLLLEVWRKTQRLVRDLRSLAVRENVISKKVAHHVHLDPELVALARCVYDSFHHHIHTPVALGAKHADVVSKCTALLHSSMLENVGQRQQEMFLQSIFSLTCDMGTEIHIPEVKTPLMELQPLLFRPPSLGLRDDMIDEDDPAGLGTSPGFLGHVIAIPGLQHVVDNVLSGVHMAMPHFEHFMKELRNIEALLRDRRGQFVMTCIVGTPHEEHKEKFMRFGFSLYEGRWHEIIKFVQGLSQVLGILSKSWNEDSFGKASTTASAEGENKQRSGPRHFDPSFLTRTLRNPLFHCYVTMVERLDSIPESFVSWASGCRCHEQWCAGRGVDARASIFEAHYGKGASSCPMAGRRAPELAAGRVRDVITLLASSCIVAPCDEQAVYLSTEESTTLHHDLSLALDHIAWSMEAKLRFWRDCPWLLCGLAHHDPVIVQKTAADVQVESEIMRMIGFRSRTPLRFLFPNLVALLNALT